MEPKPAATHVAVPKPPVMAGLRLPLQVLSLGDVLRLNREIENLEEFFEKASIKGATTKTMPQTSQLLTAFCNENSLNLLQLSDRKAAGAFFKDLRKTAPIIHVSFATDPKPDFLMKLMHWFRTQAHPYSLFKVGLQPTIAAGCIVRTANKQFDFSFKQHFQDSKAKLSAVLRAKS